MSLNRNAKGLKSDRRLQREIFDREDREDRQGLWSDFPCSPELTEEYLRLYGAGRIYSTIRGICGHCWHATMVTHEFYMTAQTLKPPEARDWVHANTGHKFCSRKKRGQQVLSLPGLLIIEELTL